MQLASKMMVHFGPVQCLFLEMICGRRNALHANRMAQKLHAASQGHPGCEGYPESGGQCRFATIPLEVIPACRKSFSSMYGMKMRSEVRWMCSFDTTNRDIEGLCAAHMSNAVEASFRSSGDQEGTVPVTEEPDSPLLQVHHGIPFSSPHRSVLL
jgi:threonine aldolase